MKQRLRHTFHVLALSLAALTASAAGGGLNSPVGAWRTIDDKTGSPLVGLVFMRHMKLDDGEAKDGDILDPDNGSIYRCKLRLEDGGRKLKVRGFIGFSVFGRTQTWERAQ